MNNKEVIKILKAIKGDFEQVFRYSYHDIHLSLEKAIEALEERPQGEWIDDKNNSYYANCSCCGYQIDTHYERGYLNFCPNCGADMRGGRE